MKLTMVVLTGVALIIGGIGIAKHMKLIDFNKASAAVTGKITAGPEITPPLKTWDKLAPVK